MDEDCRAWSFFTLRDDSSRAVGWSTSPRADDWRGIAMYVLCLAGLVGELGLTSDGKREEMSLNLPQSTTAVLPTYACNSSSSSGQ